jgi:hypothetical protein
MTIQEIIKWMREDPKNRQARVNGWLDGHFLKFEECSTKDVYDLAVIIGGNNITRHSIDFDDALSNDWEPVRPRTGLNFLQAVEWYGKTGIRRPIWSSKKP